MLIERLQKHAGLSSGQLERYAATASKRYKVFKIPKRKKGERTIEQPSRAIKAIQRWINRSLISHFPVHESATAYSKGASIKNNASKHIKSSFTLHVDFKAFFPSFGGDHVEAFLNEKASHYGIELTSADISFVRRIVCRNDALTIGAPSSPLLTNIMMFDFDNEISEFCKERNLIFTRYADDIFISSFEPNALHDALDKITKYSSSYRFAQLRLNHDKTAYLSRRYRRSITGLVVTPTHNISIGRDRKTYIKSKVYEFQQGRLPLEMLSHVRGMLAFVRDVEPSFYLTLTRKYGQETLERLETGT